MMKQVVILLMMTAAASTAVVMVRTGLPEGGRQISLAHGDHSS
jgi:hypothetical protein